MKGGKPLSKLSGLPVVYITQEAKLRHWEIPQSQQNQHWHDKFRVNSFLGYTILFAFITQSILVETKGSESFGSPGSRFEAFENVQNKGVCSHGNKHGHSVL